MVYCASIVVYSAALAATLAIPLGPVTTAMVTTAGVALAREGALRLPDHWAVGLILGYGMASGLAIFRSLVHHYPEEVDRFVNHIPFDALARF